MSKQRYGGKLEKRGSRQERRLELGYYLIVTDTKKTEENYFLGLRDSLPVQYRDKIALKVIKTKTENLIREAKSLSASEAQYRELWIVFDRDRVTDFDAIVRQAMAEGINVGWSNPCIEVWFHAYFNKMPSADGSVLCCKNFRNVFRNKTSMEYSKSEKDIYRHLQKYGDEKKAIQLAEKKLEASFKEYSLPSDMTSTTTVHHLVKDIKDRIKE